jgi:hypothetical protein
MVERVLFASGAHQMSRRYSGRPELCLCFLVLVSAGCSIPPRQPDPPGGGPAVVTLHEGDIAPVAGTDLTIRVERVTDLTSQGCLGGAVGCRDQVLLEVTRGARRSTLVLYVAHTQAQREQRVNQAQILGYTITLAELRGKHVTLDIRQSGEGSES